MKKVVAYFYDTEKEARKAAQRMNKEKGKNVYIVLEEDGGWIVLHINQLLS